MFKFYSEKDVKALVARLREEYAAVLKKQQEETARLKGENLSLRARVQFYEAHREEISSALERAVSEGERVKQDGAKQAESDRRELLLLSEKCRLLSDRLLKKYPDEDDCVDFKVFTDSLRAHLGQEAVVEETDGFRMEDVLNPKGDLDLEELCRGLGLIEEDSQ